MYYELEKLKDQEIITIVFTEKDISFTFRDGDVLVYDAIGDYCSSSYIEDIDNLEVLQNAIVLEVYIESGETKELEDHEVSKWTFYKFKTTKGYATLSFRNNSNGYYDGYLKLKE